MKKIQLIALILGAGMAVTSCGGGARTEVQNKDLDNLISQRDSLKNALTELNKKIELLDTNTVTFTPMVSVMPVEVKDFIHQIEVQGAVDTDKNAMLNAEANGTIRKVHVEEGQRVTQGQALVTIDASILSSQISEMQTQLELANYMFEKQKALMEGGVGTEMEYEQAKANKKNLESSIRTMQSRQGKTVVRAPFSGIVDEVMVSLGEMAAPGVPLLRLVNNTDVKVTASLSESLLSSVSVGTEVELHVPSLNDTIIMTKISSKGNFIDPVNRTFRIRIDINKNSLLLPNQLAKVRVTDFKKKDALVINSQSILQDTQNNTYIYKLGNSSEKGHELIKVFVKVISKYKGEACVEPLAGTTLSADDKIVVDGAKGVTEADIVNIQ
jgi:RND family efflux transporter MFP subunit